MTVPAGYNYEVSGRNVVGALRAAIGPHYAGEDVSAGHDWGYKKKGDVEVWAKSPSVERVLEKSHSGPIGQNRWFPLRRPLTKWEIDEIMRSDPEDPRRVQVLLYWGVRLFGWWDWNGWDDWTKQRLEALSNLCSL